MKRIISIIAMLVILVNTFAGKGIVVTQKFSSAANNGAAVTVTWYVTADNCKMKMDFSDSKVNTSTYFIPQTTNGRLITYSDDPTPSGLQKTYYEIPLQNIKGGSETNVTRVKVEHTGEVKIMSGISCEKLIVRTNKSSTEMWVTKDFKPAFYSFYNYFQNSFELMGLSEEKIGGVPLSSITKDNAGVVISQLDLLSANMQELNESDFKTPAGFVSAEELSKQKK